MKIPKFLRNLLQSNNYWNKSGGRVMIGLSNRRNQEWNMFNN